MKSAIIDADIFVYSACAANEEHVDVGAFDYKITDSARVEYKIIADVEAVKARLGVQQITMALSSPDNFRNDLWVDYKGHRDPKARPCGLRRARDWVQRYFPSLMLAGLEADDVLGLESRNFDYIVSDDKDLMTIPDVLLYRPGKDEIVRTTEASADHYWMTQTLIGDTADGYKGCPGVGKVKAEKLLGDLEGLGALWGVVVEAFEKAGLTQEDALLQARLARILRPGEYADSKPILWTP